MIFKRPTQAERLSKVTLPAEPVLLAPSESVVPDHEPVFAALALSVVRAVELLVNEPVEVPV